MNKYLIPIEKCYDPKGLINRFATILQQRDKAGKTYFNEIEAEVKDKADKLQE